MSIGYEKWIPCDYLIAKLTAYDLISAIIALAI